MSLHDLSCVVHVHSTHSDGTATVPEIAAAARQAGAGAVLVTDHDAKAAGEGWYEGVLVLCGVEVSLRRGGHLLAFGIDAPIRHRGMDAASAARAVHERGGFGIAAHPFAHAKRSPARWSALDALGIAGVEVWNVASDVVDTVRSPLDAVRFLLAPDRVLDAGPPVANLAAWDRLGARRRTVGVAGPDAHQLGLRIAGRVLTPMPNHRWFGWVRTHLLLDAPTTGELASDRALVLGALREGRAWLHRPPAGPADRARFWLERDGEPDVAMGAETEARPGRLSVELPGEADVRVLRDGAPIAHGDGVDQLEVGVAAPGVHRVEARREGRVWLLSNPIYLRGSPAVGH
jgi:hypothetical protein